MYVQLRFQTQFLFSRSREKMCHSVFKKSKKLIEKKDDLFGIHENNPRSKIQKLHR